MQKTNLSLLLIFLLSACTKSYQPRPDTLVVALSAQPLTLDPRYATDATGIRIASLIFSGFVRVGNDFKVLPEAAERWTVTGAVYHFYLKPGLKFHNGRAVTRADLLYTWDFYRGPRSPYASGLKRVQKVSVVEQQDRLVMRVELDRPSDAFLLGELPAVKILPQTECEAAGDDFHQALIGSGPYRFKAQNLNEIRLQGPNGDLVFKVIRDDFTRYQKMLKGEVDIAQNELPPSKVIDFKKYPERFQVKTYPGLNMTYLLINLRDPLLKQRAVRIALAQTIDRELIIRHKLNGLATPATSILTPNNPYFNPLVENPKLDPAAAASTLRAAGGEGQVLHLKTANSPAVVDIGRVLAHAMEQAGVKVRHSSYEWATFYDDVKKGNFQLATMKWVGTVDPDIYQAAFHSRETPPGRNRGHYSNPMVDRLLDQGQREHSVERRRAVYREVQKLVHEDVAIIPLWYDVQVAVARSEVENFEPVMTSDYWPFLQVFKRR